MPTSALECAPKILNLIWEVRHHVRSIVDVGAGYGKYGGLIREYVFPESNRVHLTALEVHDGYVTKERYCQYDDVLIIDARSESIDWQAWDLVLMVDVIEHLEKDEALELLDRIPGYVIVGTPVEFFQNPSGLPDSEKHRSHWKREDFAGWSWTELHGAHIARRDPIR